MKLSRCLVSETVSVSETPWLLPDILIVDEVLSVGDFQFQEKCERRIYNMIDKGTTILFVSHSIDQVKKICNKIVWLEQGHMKCYGDAREICNEYKKS